MEELIIKAFEDLEEKKLLILIQQALEEGLSSDDILQCLNTGVKNVGILFETGEYFIADLMMAGIIFKEILEMDAFQPTSKDIINQKYSILLGTVFDDLHDIGKDIFKNMAIAAGFQVIDLGMDVSSSSFVDHIIRLKPTIVALSGVLFASLDSMTSTIQYIEEGGLRKDVKILVGGRMMTKEANEFVGADAYTDDATEGIKICQKWVREIEENNND